MILGGSLGNFFDRIYYSAVPDFIDLNYNGYHWCVFNVADIFLTIGIFLLIFSEILKKKMKNKALILLIILIFVTSCSGLKPRSQKADEFLIEKKNPLVMPPNINDLPKPKDSLAKNEENVEENDFKNTININKIKTENSTSEKETTLTESVIKKIEQ